MTATPNTAAAPAHTPGPWSVNEINANGDPSKYFIFIEPGVAVIERKASGECDMPDARLIAAAPELLAEGKALRTFMQAMADAMGLDAEDTRLNFKADGKTLVSVSMAEVFARWDAALAKATGSAA